MRRTFRETAKTWYMLLRGIELTKELRDDNQPSNIPWKENALNAQMLLSLAAVVEGSLFSLLIEHIKQSDEFKQANKIKESTIRKLFDEQIDQLLKSTWKDLPEKYNLFLEISLNQFTHWEAVNKLLELRNILAHGGTIVRGVDMISDVDSSDLTSETKEQKIEIHNRKKLFDYLSKKKLVKAHGVSNWDFLNSDVSNHFFDKCISFLILVHKGYKIKYPSKLFVNEELDILHKFQITQATGSRL